MDNVYDDVTKLSPKQRELLELLLRKEGISLLQLPITRQERNSDFLPLSFAQQRLWFFEHWEPNSAVYNMFTCICLAGPLNRAVLEQSFNEIVRRHEILRTTFPTVEGQASQVIAPALTLHLPLVELRHVSQIEQTNEVRRLAKVNANQPFGLAGGPLIRTYLLRLAEEEHVLLLAMHHIISDGWSMNLLFEELSTLYNAFLRGENSPLPELPIQYTDYSLWQRRFLQGEALKAQREYWRQQLRDVPRVLELPTDRPRPLLQTFRGAAYHFTLPESLSEDVKLLSRREGTTVFMTLLAAFQVLLHRYSGQGKIPVGTTVANRNRVETEKLIGIFFNTLVMYTDLTAQPSFREALRRVREVAVHAYANQDLPFEQVVDALHVERELNRTALFQVLFEFQNTSHSPVTFTGIASRFLDVGYTVAKFDLTLDIEDTGQRLEGFVEYNADLFDATTIQRWMGHFQTLLEGIVADPTQSIAALPLLTAAERQELLLTRNETHLDFPETAGFHQLFSEQARRTPDAIAVEDTQGSLTYEQLEQRSNQLARYLQEQGVGPEVRVALCLERSRQMLIALLAIFKAGGAFVPLDAHFPPDRLVYMLTDASASLLLTQRELVGRFPLQTLPGLRILCLDSEQQALACLSEQAVDSQVSADNLAYIMYTSGSTGRPKGVLIPHRGLLNYLLWCVEAYGAAQGSGAPVQSSIAADAIFPSLFAPLLVGATVVFLPESHALESLKQVLQERGGFSLIKITPTQLEVLNQQIPADADATSWVRTLVVGAEALRGDILDFWQRRAPGTIVLNEYGPTETVVGCSIYQVPPTQLISGPVPIGLPIANTQFYVLDAQMQLVPIGVVGELYIGGAGVAWGYLNQAALTAERFVPDPFSAEPGARLYKTGDLVRYLPDRASNIEFVGRADQQVKIRGYRVELGEIEAMLAQHPAVEQIVVTVCDEAGRSRQLVAYVASTQRADLGVADLRAFVQRKLPDYMVPAAFVFLESLPLTATGKVDLAALPTPERTSRGGEKVVIAPRTAVEEQLAEIWKHVLDLDEVGIHDSFFDLGGDSILAIQIIAKARAAGVMLTVKHLFQYQTIAELAAVTDRTPPQPSLAEQKSIASDQSLEAHESSSTPSDFPEAGLSREKLDALIKKLG